MESNRYVGKICSFCKTAFQDNDDIVVCPACGIPHHQDCWQENGGCSTFGCSQTSFNEPSPAATVTAASVVSPTVCTNCGAPIADGFQFCILCGTRRAEAGSGLSCIRCGSRLPVNANVCPYCGLPVHQ